MVKVINIDTKTRTIRVENAADGDIKTWRTTESGAHFPIKKGESTKEALDKFVASKRKGSDDKRNTDEILAEEATRQLRKKARESLTPNQRKKVDLMSAFKSGKISEEEFMKSAEQIFQKEPDKFVEKKRPEAKKESGLLGDRYDAKHGTKPEKSNAPLLGDREVKDVTQPADKKHYEPKAQKEYDKKLWEKAHEEASKRAKGYPTFAEVQSMYDYMQEQQQPAKEETPKKERSWMRGPRESEDAYFERREKTLAEARKIDKVSDWYKKAFAGDDAFPKNKDITFDELAEGMLSGKIQDFYETVGVGESDVREKIFTELSERTGRPYDDFYDAWLHGGKPGTTSRIQKQKESIEYMDKLLKVGDLDPELKRLIINARDRAKKEIKK